MRRMWILGWFLMMAVPSWAAKRVSIVQLEQMLTADVAAHRPDLEIAKRLAGIELTERASTSTLTRLEAPFSASPLTLQQLHVLADRSQFQDLPANESVTDAAPDSAAQALMLKSAHGYVSETLRRLPNFLATRTINLYDDAPQALKQGDWPTRAGLRLAGTSHAEISVSRERDDQPPEQASAVWQSRTGLLSGGEFGTTLGMILTDAAKGEIQWSHWERTSTGLSAVFHYTVPASASHFELLSSLQREATVEGVRGQANGRGVSGIALRPNVTSNNVELVKTRPAYHGSIWLNPADGAIDRITMEADMSKGLPYRRAAMLVDYGPVDISGSKFICPVRSLALSEAVVTADSYTGSSATMWLNETLFTHYHRFASTSRIVESEANSPGPGATGAEHAPPAATAAPVGVEPAGQGEAAGESAGANLSGSGEPSAAAATLPAVVPSSGSPVPAAESSESGATKAPPPSAIASPANAASANASVGTGSEAASAAPPLTADHKEGDFSIRVEVNSLLVPVVVLDKNHRSLGGLTQSDFIVEDDGKPRKIVGFTVGGRGPRAGVAGVTGEQGSPSNGGAGDGRAKTVEPAAIPTRHVIFLFDDRHMTAADLSNVQKAATHLLEKPLPETDDAIVLSFTGINSGLTRDVAVLKSAIMKLMVHPMFQRAKEDCPDLDYYSGDQIIAKHNAMEFQVAVQKARQCSMSQDIVQPGTNLYTGLDNARNPFQLAAMAAAQHAVAMGEEDARESLLSLRNVVQAVGKLPGRHTLVFVSPGFLTLAPDTMVLKSEIMDLAAASDVTVNALDARGLYAGNLDTSEGGSTSTLGLINGQAADSHLSSMESSENVMSELAAGTGGRFFHNSNDLDRGMETLTAVPESLYLLEVSLNEIKANGAYHRLTVKVNRPGVEVLARKGFVAPKAAPREK